VAGFGNNLELAPEDGFARVAGEAPDRVEARDLEFHRRVREGFLALAGEEAEATAVVDAGGTEEEVFSAVRTALAKVI